MTPHPDPTTGRARDALPNLTPHRHDTLSPPPAGVRKRRLLQAEQSRLFPARRDISQNLADMVLTATYCRDMYRSAVHDPNRVALVLGCMLLAELVEAEQLRITPDGLVNPRGQAPGRDTAADAVLLDMRQEPIRHPARKWIDYLALQRRSTSLVWQRLVESGDAAAEKVRWPRRGPTFTLTGVQSTDWARRFLITASTEYSTVPFAAATLWHALDALALGEEIGLPATPADRLAATSLPADMTTLFDALDQTLTELSTRL